MISVFVDLAPLAPDGSNGGSRPSVLALLSALAARGMALHLLVKPEAAPVVEPLRAEGAALHLLGSEVREPRRALRTRRLLLGIPDRGSLRRLGASLLLSPLGTATFHERGLPHVVIAHDFQELALPRFFDARQRRCRREFRATLRHATRVVAVSEATRRMAVERVGVASERAVAIPPVVPVRTRLPDGELHERLQRLGLAPGAFALYPANYWPHKNHARLLEALALLPEEISLALCGALDEPRERLRARAAAAGLGERLRALPYLPDQDVTALLQGARLLLFPSLFEGFGIPVLEAFRLGTPVACSSLPALEELSAGAALTFDPADPQAIASAARVLWSDEAVRRVLVERGHARARAFEPAAAAGAFADVVRAAVSPR